MTWRGCPGHLIMVHTGPGEDDYDADLDFCGYDCTESRSPSGGVVVTSRSGSADTPEHRSDCIGLNRDDDLAGLCDCRTLNLIDAYVEHNYGTESDCICGRNFATVRGLREHITKMREGK